MLDAFLVTLGIAVVSFSLLYKLLLPLYQLHPRSRQHLLEKTNAES